MLAAAVAKCRCNCVLAAACHFVEEDLPPSSQVGQVWDVSAASLDCYAFGVDLVHEERNDAEPTEHHSAPEQLEGFEELVVSAVRFCPDALQDLGLIARSGWYTLCPCLVAYVAASGLLDAVHSEGHHYEEDAAVDVEGLDDTAFVSHRPLSVEGPAHWRKVAALVGPVVAEVDNPAAGEHSHAADMGPRMAAAAEEAARPEYRRQTHA